MKRILAAAILSMTGCSTYMSSDLKRSLRTEDQGKVQYYLSSEIKLWREMGVDEHDVTPGHQIQIVKGKKIEEVIFPKKIPGVQVAEADNRLMISFENGTSEFPNPALPFVPNGESGRGCRWWILPGLESLCRSAVRGSSNAYKITDGDTVDYMGKQFSVHGYAYLIVDAKKMTRDSKEVRRVQGRKAGQ